MPQIQTIRLELEGIKHSIMSHLTDHNGELEREIEKQLSQFIETFEWSTVVNSVISECVKKFVHNYFNVGYGHDLLQQALTAALDELWKKKTTQISEGESEGESE